jgi:EAL domain-containing protein (putative c-di-GMP-specific phosphodiesterase class I)/CheY-like chemotaxis protein
MKTPTNSAEIREFACNAADDPRSNRLLVIDHDRALGHLIENAAQDAGFEVVLTQDPSTFVKKALTWKPTVLMLDLRIPDIDGIELLRGLAADRCAAQVILMSGTDDKVIEAAMQIGRDRGLNMTGVLQKPVELEALRELLSRHVPECAALRAGELAGAIDSNQLFLEYQLKFDCRLARMTGLEALVRWRHPALGVIQPDRFIALAEETILIHRLTDWVVVAAARQVAAWRRQNAALDVSVNISARNLEDIELPDRLHRHCLDAGIDCASITLELTETGAMGEAVRMMDVLTRLRLKGFKLAIDDFGIGYSSLVQLQRMPFSEIKIDRSFVIQMMSNDGCRAIVEIVIDLARKLKLRSVAEGVEDEAALRRLMALGCDAAQGYHLSRPVTADLIPAFITQFQLLRKCSEAPATPVASPFTNARAWRRRKTSTSSERRVRNNSTEQAANLPEGAPA